MNTNKNNFTLYIIICIPIKNYVQRNLRAALLKNKTLIKLNYTSRVLLIKNFSSLLHNGFLAMSKGVRNSLIYTSFCFVC